MVDVTCDSGKPEAKKNRFRVAFYSHDSFGLGHLRRNLTLAAALTRRMANVEVLIVSGSPRAYSFELPERVSVTKLPCVTKDDEGKYVTRHVKIPLADTVRLRKNFIRQAVFDFAPDCVVVDHTPTGLQGELLPLLADLRDRHGTELILGLRDILDEPERVVQSWRRQGVYDLMDSLYDRVWIYGDPQVFPLHTLYQLGTREHVDYVGYLGRDADDRWDDTPCASASFDASDRPHLLCLTGGGGDGYPLARTFFDMLRENPDQWNGTLLTGPFLSRSERHQLARQAAAEPHVQVLRFTSETSRWMATSDLIITMGGYNSLMETVSWGKQVLVVPRVFPRREQWLRATAFQRHGLVQSLDPDDLSTARLAQEVTRCLNLDPPPQPAAAGIDWNGARNFAARMQEVLEERSERESQTRRPNEQLWRA